MKGISRARAGLAGLVFGALSAASSAQPAQMDWGEVAIPVQRSDWGRLDNEQQSFYLVGALQAVAYVQGRTSGEERCLMDLTEAAGTAVNGMEEGGPIIGEIITFAISQCSETSDGENDFLSTTAVFDFFGARETEDAWIGFMLGMTDMYHFYAFGQFDEETADCFQEEGLEIIPLDLDDPDYFTETPDAPFAEATASAMLQICGVLDE